MNTLAKYILHTPNALCKPLCMVALLCGLTALAGIMTGCEDKPLAFNYCPTPVEGWEPGDTLKFHVDTVKTAGTYRIDLGVRTSSSTPYPFQSLWLVVRQHWHNPNRELCDTVMFKLTNQRGDPNGHGVTIYQYDMPWQQQQIAAGASVDISISHIMRREILPGIADVGIRVQKVTAANP